MSPGCETLDVELLDVELLKFILDPREQKEPTEMDMSMFLSPFAYVEINFLE